MRPRSTSATRTANAAGPRTERVTLVAARGGRGEAPPVSVRWYDLGSGEIETARREGFPIRIEGPPARTDGPAQWSRLLQTGLYGLIAAACAFVLRTWFPRLTPPCKSPRIDVILLL